MTDNAIGGFSEAKPWLPMAVEHLEHSVARQQDNPDSMMQFYRRLIAFRKTQTPLIKGTMEIGTRDDTSVTLTRRSDNHTLFCAFNFGDTGRDIEVPDGDWRVAADAPFDVGYDGQTLTLPPYSAGFLTSNAT